MFADVSEQEKIEQVENNDISLSFTEKRIWDMWRRWRQSEYNLWPWQYMTNGEVYADDIIDLESMESIASKLEKEHNKYREGLEESKRNSPNPNVRSLI